MKSSEVWNIRGVSFIPDYINDSHLPDHFKEAAFYVALQYLEAAGNFASGIIGTSIVPIEQNSIPIPVYKIERLPSEITL